jgi:hypothetical protein
MEEDEVVTRTISCEVVGEINGINEIDDDANCKVENSNTM